MVPRQAFLLDEIAILQFEHLSKRCIAALFATCFPFLDHCRYEIHLSSELLHQSFTNLSKNVAF